jgi:hypothetical protein
VNGHEPLSALNPCANCVSYSPKLHQINHCAELQSTQGQGDIQVQYSANTIEEMQKLLLDYRDNMRVEVETGVELTTKPWQTCARLPLGQGAWS